MSNTSNTIGILLFNGVEELDFAGPWEVFQVGVMLESSDRAVTIAEKPGPVRCAKGLSVNPDHTFEDAPQLDVVLVPGGQGTRIEVHNPALIAWLQKVAPACRWVTSVCTGSLLLQAAGLTDGKRITTHWGFIETLRQNATLMKQDGATVLDNVRYVRDGNLVTAAGVSAGIDMALWLLGQMHNVELARQVQRRMQYDPAPPYAAEV
jgi:transcriptional regulator GlxA family with amidase domain